MRIFLPEQLVNLFHSGQVETGSCFQKYSGTVRTGVILKDVCVTAYGGELMAVLGSRGSGKRALLDVIARQAKGPTRGRIALNGVPLSLELFNESCAFINFKTDEMFSGLTVKQSLQFCASLVLSKAPNAVKRARVSQILADFALTDLSERQMNNLTLVDLRRLQIAHQMMKDPILMLMDEPTVDLDPLNAYFIVSILSNYVKKYNRMAITTLEKPRSDIFPFLDRITYLCLGEVIYTGPTRMMLDYFRTIGFPCPELENPLMYYLCLSTVDRRSRERFVESSNQISSLVEKFKLEGRSYGQTKTYTNYEHSYAGDRIPLSSYTNPSWISFIWILIWHDMLAYKLNNLIGWKRLLQLFILPILFLSVALVYCDGQSRFPHHQSTYVSKNGLIFATINAAYLAGAISGIVFDSSMPLPHFPLGKRYFRGSAVVMAKCLLSIPISAFVSFTSALVMFRMTKKELLCHKQVDEVFCQIFDENISAEMRNNGTEFWTEFSYLPDFVQYWLCIWACYFFAEQQSAAILCLLKSKSNALVVSSTINSISVVFASSCVRSFVGLPGVLTSLTYVFQARYVSLTMHSIEYFNRSSLNGLSWQDNGGEMRSCTDNLFGFGCRYVNGTHFLQERFGSSETNLVYLMNGWINVGISITFVIWVILLNFIVHLL